MEYTLYDIFEIRIILSAIYKGESEINQVPLFLLLNIYKNLLSKIKNFGKYLKVSKLKTLTLRLKFCRKICRTVALLKLRNPVK